MRGIYTFLGIPYAADTSGKIVLCLLVSISRGQELDLLFLWKYSASRCI